MRPDVYPRRTLKDGSCLGETIPDFALQPWCSWLLSMMTDFMTYISKSDAAVIMTSEYKWSAGCLGNTCPSSHVVSFTYFASSDPGLNSLKLMLAVASYLS